MEPKNWKRTKMIEKLDFWARLALEIDQWSSLRESLKDTWPVETVETDTKASKAILFFPRRVVGQGLVVWKKYGRGRFFEDFSGCLCWILISFHQNGVKVCILVPAKPHGPENSVAGDWRRPRSRSWNRKIGKGQKCLNNLISEHVWPLKLINGPRYANL